MTAEEKHKRAFDELDELLSCGQSVDAAITVAAKENDLSPEGFRNFAERHLGDLEVYRERLVQRAMHDHFMAIASAEVSKCNNREGRYKRMGFDREDLVFAALEESSGGR